MVQLTSDIRKLEALRKEVRDWYGRFDSETMSVSEFEAWVHGLVKLQVAYAMERSAQQLATQAETTLNAAQGKVR